GATHKAPGLLCALATFTTRSRPAAAAPGTRKLLTSRRSILLSRGRGSCGTHSYGARYARYTRLSESGGWRQYGLMYSQTISCCAVTSKMRPSEPSVISVLPFGRRCALLMKGL